MVLGFKGKLIYGVRSGLIPLWKLCTLMGTIHVKGRWYQVYDLWLTTSLVIDQLKKSLIVLSNTNIEIGHKTYGSIILDSHL